MLSPSFLVIHDASRSGQDNIPKLSRRKEIVCPLLNFVDLNVKSWGNDTTLVQPSVQIYNDLSSSVIVDNLELSNVSFLHHDCEEPDHDLAAGSQEHLSLAPLLCIVHATQSVGQRVHANHPSSDFYFSKGSNNEISKTDVKFRPM